MNHWQKEALNLEVGDIIIWRDEAIELEGQATLVAPGMRGEVISLNGGYHLDVVQGKPTPPKARVQFESGMALMVDERMRWERVAGSSRAAQGSRFIRRSHGLRLANPRNSQENWCGFTSL